MIFPWFSWLIRMYEGTEYSHVYIRWDVDGIDEKICYQASGSMVNFIGQKVFDGHIQPVSEFLCTIELDKATTRKLMKFCVSNAGVPYGIKQVFGLMAQRLFKLNKNPLSDQKEAYVCSELVGVILEEIFSMESSIEIDDLLPKDIENLLKNSNSFKKIL